MIKKEQAIQYYPAKYKTKIEAVLDMLKGGQTTKQIKSRMLVSDSYIYVAKKQLREAAGVLELTKEQEVPDQMEPREKEASNALLHSISQGKGRDPVVGTMERKVPEGPATVVRPTTEDRVKKILDERQSEYGSYMQSADTAIKLKGIMHNAIARNDLHLFPDQLLSLDMIAVKISRIVNGNPAHRDSWVDIVGYATLVADRLQGKVRSND